MNPNPAPMMEVVPLKPVRDGHHIYLAGCCYDHAVLIAEHLEDNALRGPARIPAKTLMTWCHYCAWCGDGILPPERGACMFHGDDACPTDDVTGTMLVGECLRYLTTRYYVDGRVPSAVVAHVDVVSSRDWDYWAEAGGQALAELVVAELHPGEGVEEPF